MEKVRVDLAERSYDISIGAGVLDGLGAALSAMGLSPRAALITNPTVEAIYGERAVKSLTDAGFELKTVLIPDGEEYKDLLWTMYVHGELLSHGLDRNSVVVALGGGVIGDIAGFAASTYMRGISFVQAPTTLLAQVDSAVGGKTGVNHRLGKNMIGTFWQPRLVLADTGTLGTLPGRELVAGVAEVIKYGVIHDPELFTFLGENADAVLGLKDDAITHIVKRSCEIKAEVVSKDERESSGLRAILNYGHTVGHALETVAGYGGRYLHGEAVAAGMCVEAVLSASLGLMGRDEAEKIKGLIDSYGLPTGVPASLSHRSLTEAMSLDKKAEAGRLNIVLPERIGSVKIEKDVSMDAVHKALEDCTLKA